MTTENQIRDEKLQYDINRETAKISALSSSEIDKCEYLTGEEILPSNQQQIIEQAKFTYSSLVKAFEKHTIKNQGEEQADTLKALKPNETKPTEYNNYFINGLAEIRNSTKTINVNNLTYNFTSDSAFKGPLHIFKIIYNGDIALEVVEKDKKSLNQI